MNILQKIDFFINPNRYYKCCFCNKQQPKTFEYKNIAKILNHIENFELNCKECSSWQSYHFINKNIVLYSFSVESKKYHIYFSVKDRNLILRKSNDETLIFINSYNKDINPKNIDKIIDRHMLLL